MVQTYKAGLVLETDTCRINSTSTPTSHCQLANDDKNDETSKVLPVFLLGYALVGIGVTPIYSLGLAHIDEITSRKSSSWYYAAVGVMGILGPSVGFMVAGPILNIYVDIDQPANSNLKPTDRNWVGAWWLAFLIGSIIMFIPVIPLIGFPKRFPSTERKLEEKRQFVDTLAKEEKVQNLISSLKALLKNKSYTCLSLSISLEFLSLAGTAYFLPKLLETQFHMTAIKAATAVGFVVFPSSIVGITLGAFISRRFSLNGRQLLIFNCTALVLGCITVSGLFLGCDDRIVVGSSTNYFNSTSEVISLQNSCNKGCHCSTQFYKPVCSVADQKTFYSACHAGCSAQNFRETYYTNCSCLESASMKVSEGRCFPPCNYFPYFMIGMFIALCVGFSTEVPFVQATFRLVPEGQGSLAQGFQQMFTRFLGFIPAAPLFGSLIDKSCKLWHTDICTGKTTSCLEYDNEKFRFYFWALNILPKFIAFLLSALALKFYQLPKRKELELEEIEIEIFI